MNIMILTNAASAAIMEDLASLRFLDHGYYQIVQAYVSTNLAYSTLLDTRDEQ